MVKAHDDGDIYSDGKMRGDDDGLGDDILRRVLGAGDEVAERVDERGHHCTDIDRELGPDKDALVGDPPDERGLPCATVHAG